MDVDQSVTVHDSVAYNTTLGTGISATREDTAHMDTQDLGNWMTMYSKVH